MGYRSGCWEGARSGIDLGAETIWREIESLRGLELLLVLTLGNPESQDLDRGQMRSNHPPHQIAAHLISQEHRVHTHRKMIRGVKVTGHILRTRRATTATRGEHHNLHSLHMLRPTLTTVK